MYVRLRGLGIQIGHVPQIQFTMYLENLSWIPLLNIFSRLHPNNVIGIRSFSDQFMCTSLLEACNKYLQKHFVEVSRSTEFLGLGETEVAELLNKDELHVTSEEQVSSCLSGHLGMG